MNTIGKENCIYLNNDLECNYVDGNHNDEVENNEANLDDIDEGHKRITELDEIWGLEFDPRFEACEFYQKYAKYH